MEFLLILILVVILLSWIASLFEDKPKNNQQKTSTSIIPSTSTASNRAGTDSTERTNVNNYYTQNNLYIQQNNYNKSRSSKHTDHSARVWKRMGYKVRTGESYAYRHYGNKIYTPDQVERIGTTYQVHTSESGLAKKLLNNTGSKRMAKDILVEQYGYSQNEAKSLAGYR